MKNTSLQIELKTDLEKFLSDQLSKYPRSDLLKVDLHCHDCNSDEPSEIIGRILRVPETWIPTKRVVEELKRNGSDLIVITNHNNTRTCYELEKEGIDNLIAAEFSCYVPDFNFTIHVLAYGFDTIQENTLNKLKNNIYDFLEYACINDIPTIWAHPLYHYITDKVMCMEFFEKMLLIFERFEMLNGQRNTWQNMLVKEWVENTTPEIIDDLSKKHNIHPKKYCKDPYKKTFSGGSDSHSGFFAGLTGTYLYIPDLENRKKKEKLSDLALEAIKNGNMFPFGSHENSEKLTITFLDYVCQVAINFSDPGLLRILLHQGNTSQKTLSLIISNAFSEIQRHKITTTFVRTFHNSLLGKSPAMIKKLIVKPAYKPVFDDITKISKQHQTEKEIIAEEYYKTICSINLHLNTLLFNRFEKKISSKKWAKQFEISNLENLVEKIELPSNIRAYVDKSGKKKNNLNIGEFFDGLPFPFLTSLLILSAHFTSAKVLNMTRPFLKIFSEKLNKYTYPKRMLWLTDTFGDKNGVSITIKAMLEEIKKYDYPIDVLVCSSKLESEDHLVVVKPLYEFTIPNYPDQNICIPNFLEVHKLYQDGEYDRILCSTEGIMGAIALYLKHAFTVHASFYIHTDWVMFSQKVLNFDQHNRNRLRRFMRSFYGAFDKLFVLNNDQRKWLCSREMNFPKEKVSLTAHWVSEIFQPVETTKKEIFGLDDDRLVMLYVGRVSKEKGVLELPNIYRKVKMAHPNVALIVVGRGPVFDELKELLPEGIYWDWVNREKLPSIYSTADVFVFPSKFDTFANVVLESLSCGTPVIAYSSKGPKDIIEHGKCGYLVKTEEQMCESLVSYLGNPKEQALFRKAAVERAKNYDKNIIMSKFLEDLDL